VSVKALHELRVLARELMGKGWASSTHRVIDTARRALAEFAEMHAEERPELFLEPLFYGDLQAALHNEETFCLFAAWLFDAGLAAATVSTYVSMAKSSVTVDLGFVLTPKETEVRLPKLLKAMRKMRQRVRKRRLGWRAAYQRKLREYLGPVEGVDEATQDALLNTSRQGLLRGADFLPLKPAEFEPLRHACVGDMEQVEGPRPHLRIAVQPAKKAEQRGKSEFLLLPRGDGVTDAYASVLRMLEERRKWARAKGEELGDDEPLFWSPAMGVCTAGTLNSLFKSAAAAIGKSVVDFSSHSGRIGGCTDLFSTDCPAVLLQMQGRWDSDLWAIYARTCVGQALEVAAKAAMATDEDLEALLGTHVQPARPAPAFRRR